MKTNKQYVNSPSHCPCCNSCSIEGGSIEMTGATAIQSVSCDDCGAAWEDIYKLTGYNLTEQPQDYRLLELLEYVGNEKHNRSDLFDIYQDLESLIVKELG